MVVKLDGLAFEAHIRALSASDVVYSSVAVNYMLLVHITSVDSASPKASQAFSKYLECQSNDVKKIKEHASRS